MVVTTGGVGAPLTKVATRADQFVLLLTVKVAEYGPVDVTSMTSFAACEVAVLFSSMVNPLPAVCFPEELTGNPLPPKTSSLALVVGGVSPLLRAMLLPCADAIWSSGFVVLNPLNSYIASQG